MEEGKNVSPTPRTVNAFMFLELYSQADDLIEKINLSAADIEEKHQELIASLEEKNSILIDQYKKSLSGYHEEFLKTINKQHGLVSDFIAQQKIRSEAMERLEKKFTFFFPIGITVIFLVGIILGLLVGLNF